MSAVAFMLFPSEKRCTFHRLRLPYLHVGRGKQTILTLNSGGKLPRLRAIVVRLHRGRAICQLLRKDIVKKRSVFI